MRRVYPILILAALALIEGGVIGFLPFPLHLVSPVLLAIIYLARRPDKTLPIIPAVTAGLLLEPVSDFAAGSYALIFIVVVLAVRLLAERSLTHRSIISLGLLTLFASLIYFLLLAGGRWLSWLSQRDPFLELGADSVISTLVFGILVNVLAVFAAEAIRRLIYGKQF